MKRKFTFKAVSFLLAVTFIFKVAFCGSFFFLFINFISTIWTANNTIYFWHDERYVLKTTMIWKLRLAFDVYTSFSQVIWKKAQHDSDFLPPPRFLSLLKFYPFRTIWDVPHMMWILVTANTSLEYYRITFRLRANSPFEVFFLFTYHCFNFVTGFGVWLTENISIRDI